MGARHDLHVVRGTSSEGETLYIVEAIGWYAMNDTNVDLLLYFYFLLVPSRSNWIRSSSSDRRWKQAFALFGRTSTRKRSVSPAVLFHRWARHTIRYACPAPTQFESSCVSYVAWCRGILRQQPVKRYTRPPTLRKGMLVAPVLHSDSRSARGAPVASSVTRTLYFYVWYRRPISWHRGRHNFPGEARCNRCICLEYARSGSPGRPSAITVVSTSQDASIWP